MQVFKDLYQYRELLKTNVKKEIRGKYKGSFLGVLWSFVNPLLMVLVYAIVFPYIMRVQQDNYLIFLIVAIIPWNFFTTVVAQGSITVRMNANIIKKVYFPREILPISVVVSGLVNFLISCIIIFIFLIGSGIGLSWHLLLLPLIALIEFMLTLGIVFMVSSINIYIRDLEYLVNFIITLLFYATPILYNINMFEGSFIAKILILNPMTHIINAYRDIMYYQTLPNFQSTLIVGLISLVVMLLGYQVFKKLEKGFAEEV